jgi:diguanylate cyclase (GGDEF)-like protein
MITILNSLLNNLSIKKKLWVMSMFGSLIPMFVLFAFLFAQLMNEYSLNQEQLINEGINRVDIKLKQAFISLENISLTFVSDNEFNRILESFNSESAYDSVFATNQIEERLNSFKYVFSIIDSITVYHGNKLLNTQELVRFTDFSDLDHELSQFLEGYQSLMIRIENSDIMIYRKLNALSREHKNFIKIKVNKSVLQRSLEDTFILSNKGNSYLVDENEIVIVTSDTAYSNPILSNEKIQSTHQIMKTRFIYSTYVLKWNLITTIEKPNIFEIQSRRFFEIGLFSLGVFLVSMLFSLWISKSINDRLYRLNTAMEKTESNEFTMLEYIETKDEIGKTIQQYNEMVQSISKLVKELNLSKESTTKALSDKVEAYNELEASNEELEALNEELATLNQELVTSYEEIKVQDDQINDLIYKDALTHLSNRYAISEVIDRSLETNLLKIPMAVLFLDIDNFKLINDIHGHKIGDLVIQETGNRLKRFLSKSVSVGRFGGDEFLIFINRILIQEEIDSLLEGIKSSFEQPINVEGNKFYLTISMGVSFYPEHGMTREDLVKKADQALYSAKDSGKNKVVKYKHSMTSQIEYKTRLQTHIKSGFENREFYLNYQPYYEATTKEIVGFEALIRWNSPTLGFVSPFDLIVNAEEMGLIVEIGEWIFREACFFARRVNQLSQRPITVSINVSAVQLMDSNFLKKTVDIVNELNISPSLLCLEMTETILINSLEQGTNIVKRLRDFGFNIALDDFGTGYSSLKYFKELPVSILKIDKAFIANLKESTYDNDLVHVMVIIAHNRNVLVTAEGVETEEQYQMLLAHQCDIIQGFLLSEPVSEKIACELVYPNQH